LDWLVGCLREWCCWWAAELMLEIKGNMGQCKSAPRTLYIGFRKAKLKKTWDSLSTKAFRVMQIQFLDAPAVVCLQVWAGRL
jgi:hypothetical protein